MRLDSPLLRACLVAGLFVACNKDDPKSTSTPAADVSRKARVLPKSGEVWGRDLALGLSLSEHELCRELDSLDCISEAHRITLGGVEPARLGIDEPLETTPVSAPIAADRVALSACSLRYEKDLSGTAVVFGPVLDAPAAANPDRPFAPDPSVEARAAVSESLVERLLARAPNAEELAALEALHSDLQDVSSDPTRDWCIGACMVVATSTEALFY